MGRRDAHFLPLAAGFLPAAGFAAGFFVAGFVAGLDAGFFVTVLVLAAAYE